MFNTAKVQLDLCYADQTVQSYSPPSAELCIVSTRQKVSAAKKCYTAIISLQSHQYVWERMSLQYFLHNHNTFKFIFITVVRVILIPGGTQKWNVHALHRSSNWAVSANISLDHAEYCTQMFNNALQ